MLGPDGSGRRIPRFAQHDCRNSPLVHRTRAVPLHWPPTCIFRRYDGCHRNERAVVLVPELKATWGRAPSADAGKGRRFHRTWASHSAGTACPAPSRRLRPHFAGFAAVRTRSVPTPRCATRPAPPLYQCTPYRPVPRRWDYPPGLEIRRVQATALRVRQPGLVRVGSVTRRGRRLHAVWRTCARDVSTHVCAGAASRDGSQRAAVAADRGNVAGGCGVRRPRPVSYVLPTSKVSTMSCRRTLQTGIHPRAHAAACAVR